MTFRFFDLIGDFLGFLRRQFSNICRAMAYARLGYTNKDWDHAYFTELIVFKLKRMHYEMAHGHAAPEKTRDQSIRLAIRLGEKITGARYGTDHYSYFSDLHDKKWGTKTYDFKNRTLKSTHALAKTPEEEAQAQKEWTAAFDADEEIQRRDRRLFFAIISKYHEWWWD